MMNSLFSLFGLVAMTLAPMFGIFPFGLLGFGIGVWLVLSGWTDKKLIVTLLILAVLPMVFLEFAAWFFYWDLILGIFVGSVGMLLFGKFKLRKPTWRSLVIGLWLAFNLTVTAGVFMNGPVNKHYAQGEFYFMNRGLPVQCCGAGGRHTRLPFGYIKISVPGSDWVKIVSVVSLGANYLFFLPASLIWGVYVGEKTKESRALFVLWLVWLGLGTVLFGSTWWLRQ